MSTSFSTTDWLTLGLVLITAFYAWATFQILKENKAVVAAMNEQTEALLRPYIVSSAFARMGTTVLVLEIQNTGKSPAEKLRLELDKAFYQHAQGNELNNLRNLPAFSQTIESLAPGARLQFILGAGHEILNEVEEKLCPKVFSIHASYCSAGRSYSEQSVVDLRPLVHSTVIHDPVAYELEKLRQAVKEFLTK